jgi:hypothetical protein
VFGGGETAHVRADLGEDDLRGGRSDAGDGVQPIGQDPSVRPVSGRFGAGSRQAVVWGGDLFQGLGDEAVEFVDLGGEMVNGAQQHAQQSCVVALELPGQGLGRGRLLLDEAALGEFRESAGVTLTGPPGRRAWLVPTCRTGPRRHRTA